MHVGSLLCFYFPFKTTHVGRMNCFEGSTLAVGIKQGYYYQSIVRECLIGRRALVLYV